MLTYRGSYASLGIFSVEVQRLTDSGEYGSIPSTGKVPPFAALRIYVTGLSIFVHSVEITLRDSMFAAILIANPNVGVDGRVRYDFQAPAGDGSYTVQVRSQGLGSDLVYTGFQVNSINPDPPPTDPPSGGIGGFFGDLKPILIFGVVGIIAIQALGLMRKR